MLPFLEPKKIVSVMVSRRGKTPVETQPEVEMGENKVDPSLKEASEDILRAIESKSVIDLAKAIQSAFYICDSYPHEEGEHTDAWNEDRESS